MFLTACRCCLFLLLQLNHLRILFQFLSFNIIKLSLRARKLHVNNKHTSTDGYFGSISIKKSMPDNLIVDTWQIIQIKPGII